ncbi:unnamed protein product [Calypogeia fissa]
MEDSSSDRGSGNETSRIRLDSSDLLEELWSPESDEFLYMIGTLMAKHENRVLSQQELDMLHVMEQRPLGSYGDYQLRESKDDDHEENGSAVVGKSIESETPFMERSDMAGAQQPGPTKKRRFFGIYPRVQLKAAWRKLTKLGVVLRSKKMRLIDIHSNSSSLMNDYERWCQEDAMFLR